VAETPDERAARAERLYEKCALRGGGSMADIATLRNDVRAFAAELAAAIVRAETAEAALTELREMIAAQIASLGESRARNAHTTGPLAVVDRVQADTYRTAAWLIRNPDQFSNRGATPHADLERAADEQSDGT